MSAEENWNRVTLLGQDKVTSSLSTTSPDSVTSFAFERKKLGTDAELRKRLGITSTNRQDGKKELGFEKQLEEDAQFRDSTANDILNLAETLRHTSLNVQRSLEHDSSRIEGINNLIGENLQGVKKEISRVNFLFNSTSLSCRANCMTVLFVLGVWMGVYILIKITPRP